MLRRYEIAITEDRDGTGSSPIGDREINIILVGGGNEIGPLEDEFLNRLFDFPPAEQPFKDRPSRFPADPVIVTVDPDHEWNAAKPTETPSHKAVVLSPLTGRALTEAAFGAAPIVAYDIDWQADLIQTGSTGELVPFRQIEQLADSAERFLKDATYASSMGRAVRERALAMLDPQRLNAHERQQYATLLERWNVGRRKAHFNWSSTGSS